MSRDNDNTCPPETVAHLTGSFRCVFGESLSPGHVVSAPGRVNLIGEHTDYNDGFVFPIAIDRYINVACRARDDRAVRVVAADLDRSGEFALDEIQADPDSRWLNYVRGCALELGKAGFELTGVDLAIAGTVPVGAGVSSSAALELAVSSAFLACAGASMPLPELALLCQRVENDFVGVGCGIMDQYISALGERDHAMLLDCESLEHRMVRIPAGAAFVVCDTGKARSLGDSAYNERRAQCEAGAARLGVKSLRHASTDQLEAARDALDDVVYRRCRHVIGEIGRAVRGAERLEAGDFAGFGALMGESHTSLRDDYEVSCRELDVMVEASREAPGCLGARLTGAGFGGCAVAMVEPPSIEAFIEQTAQAYVAETDLEPMLYPVAPSQGVSVTAVE